MNDICTEYEGRPPVSLTLCVNLLQENRWLLLPWLAWGVVSLAMQGVWVIFTAPYMPSVRPSASLFQLGWGIHFFLVVKTQYTRVRLMFGALLGLPRLISSSIKGVRFGCSSRLVYLHCFTGGKVWTALRSGTTHFLFFSLFLQKNGR